MFFLSGIAVTVNPGWSICPSTFIPNLLSGGSCTLGSELYDRSPSSICLNAKIGLASTSTRALLPAVTMMKFPGRGCVEFGAYKSTEPRRMILFTVLNLSPPCAASAARARSSGAVVAVIDTAVAPAPPLVPGLVTSWELAARGLKIKTMGRVSRDKSLSFQ